MADPFRPDTKSQLLREAQVGLSIVAILLVLLVYVAFYRITGRGRHIPNHVRNAPVAQIVWPQNTERIATREIEMTPQEFRDTRMPKAASTVGAGSKIDSVSPTASANVKSLPPKPSLRSSYQTQTSNAAMAEAKTSRSNTQLGSPNFSPNSGSAGKKNLPPVVADSFKPSSTSDFPITKTPKLAKAPETISFPDTKTPPPKPLKPLTSPEIVKAAKVVNAAKEIKPVESTSFPASAEPPAKPPVDPFMMEGLDDSQNDPKVELASLKQGGNDFKPNLPGVNKAASPSPDSPKPDSTNGMASKEFQPAPPSKEQTASEQSNPRLSDFVGLKNNSNALRPEPKNQFKPAQNLAQQAQKPSPPRPKSTPGLKNLLVAPVLDPSRPIADHGNDTVLAKRLPRLQANKKLPAEKNQTKEQFRESQLSQREYATKAGDNFWSIAQSVYGDGKYFRALYKYNEPHVPEFDSLEPGTIIGTPPLEDLAKLWPDLCPSTEAVRVAKKQDTSVSENGWIYITRSGDTVFDIARQRLGQASRYSEILNLNQTGLGQEVSHLTPLKEGVRIVMPE